MFGDEAKKQIMKILRSEKIENIICRMILEKKTVTDKLFKRFYAL